MCRRLIFLVFLVLVLALAGNASAALLAYWNFEGNYNSIPNAGLFSGTAVGTGVSIGTGAGEYKLGTGALKIDDDGVYDASALNPNYVDIPNPVTPLVAPQQISTSLWFKFADISADGSRGRNFLYEGYEPTASQYSLSLGIRDDTDTTDPSLPTGYGKIAQYYYMTPSSSSINNSDNPGEDGYSGIISDGQWHHIVNIWDRLNNKIEMWIDGVAVVDHTPIEDVSWDGMDPVLDDLRTEINGYPETGMAIGVARALSDERNWDGYIDDFGIMTGHLSDADIAYLWNGGAGNPVPEPATIALLGMGGLMLLRRKRRA